MYTPPTCSTHLREKRRALSRSAQLPADKLSGLPMQFRSCDERKANPTPCRHPQYVQRVLVSCDPKQSRC